MRALTIGVLAFCLVGIAFVVGWQWDRASDLEAERDTIERMHDAQTDCPDSLHADERVRCLLAR